MLLVCLGSSSGCSLGCSFLLWCFLTVLWINSLDSRFVVLQLNKTNNPILNLAPENITQHSGIE